MLNFSNHLMEESYLYMLSLLAFTTLCAWYFSKRVSLASKRKHPPSPRTLPIIGNLHQLRRMPHRSLQDLSRKHGPLMLIALGSRPALVVSSAAVGKEIFKTHDLSFANRPEQIALKKVFYDMTDLVNLSYGDQWRKVRSLFVHELMSTAKVKSFSSIREEEIDLLVRKIGKCCLSSSPVNLTDMFEFLANDLICRAALGKKHSEHESGKKSLELINKNNELFFTFTLGEFIPWLSWMNHLNGYNAALDRCAKESDQVLETVINDHLKSFLENSGGDHKAGKGRECFMDILLRMYTNNIPTASMDLISLKGVILDVFGAGTDTAATALVWVMTEVMRHPTIIKKIQAEIDGIMNGDHHITEDDLEKMQYLKAVIKETFRLHPPIAIISREAREYVNLMGYDVPKGIMILINVWAIGRDPNCWNEPGKFMPERFLNCSVDLRGWDYELIPFGAGRRICPGIGFATRAIELTLANLMHKFDWALPSGAKPQDLDVTERYGFTIGKKDPLVVVPTKRCF